MRAAAAITAAAARNSSAQFFDRLLSDNRRRRYREMRLKHWAGYPQFWPRGSCCPRPYTWFRARFLYAILPADAGRWQTLRNPKTVGIFMLSFCPFYAVSVWVFVLLFCLIDKTDEYQLSQYILKFKTTQFLIGLFGLIQFASKMFYCLDGVNDFYDGVNVNGTHDRCVVAAPGQRPQDDYLIAMEPVRVGFVYLAWFLLWSGRAYGGKAELLALEHVRVDAADGSLDGQLAKEKLKTNVNQKASGTTSEALYRAATKGARKLYDAKPQYGGTHLGRSGRPHSTSSPAAPPATTGTAVPSSTSCCTTSSSFAPAARGTPSSSCRTATSAAASARTRSCSASRSSSSR